MQDERIVTRARTAGPPSPPRIRRVGVVVTPAMSLSSALLALEPLRAASRFFQRPAYEIAFVGESRAPVESGVGIAVAPGATFAEDRWLDMALVVAAYDQPEPWKRALFPWLRRLARQGAELCGVDFGAVFLAEAGLLDGRRATTHWEVRPAVAERFPDVDFRDEIFVMDGPRLTCGGHLSCHDLFLAVVERDHGAAVARFVEADLIAGPGRPGETRQGDPLTAAETIPDPRLRRAIEAMEANVEAPVPIEAIAAAAGLSLRRLQAVFRLHLGETASGRYLAIRLNAARHMLMYSEAPVTEVAATTGFSSLSSFSRAFRARFRSGPRAYRSGFRRLRARPYFFETGARWPEGTEPR